MASRLDLVKKFWLERPDPCRLVGIWLEMPDSDLLARIWLERPNSSLLAEFQQFWQIPTSIPESSLYRSPASIPESSRSMPESDSFGRNPVTFARFWPTQIPTKLFGFRPLSWILDIVAGMAESGKSGRNPNSQLRNLVYSNFYIILH